MADPSQSEAITRIVATLARAESAAPAKHCEDCAPEFGCWDGGEPCYKQPQVKSTPANHPDTVRLDWLDEVNQQINRNHGTVYGYRCDVNHNRAEVSLNDSRIPALTVRAAIDAAMKEARQ